MTGDPSIYDQGRLVNAAPPRPYWIAQTRAATTPTPKITEDPAERKSAPVYSGVLNYFPRAMVAIAQLSKQGNDKHNPGQPLHWAREKSFDHADCIARHLLDVGTVGSDGTRHSAALAWRALALLEEELEREAGIDPRTGRPISSPAGAGR